MLSLLNSKAFVILLGDTAPLSPILFDYGVDAVSGTRVVDPDVVLRCVSQGANFRQIRGVRRLTLLKR
ncbi:MAG: Rossmann-like domain-containing protein [Thermodesulfobacteriota bacterium]